MLICLYKPRIVFYINHLFSKASETLRSSGVCRRATGNRYPTFRRNVIPEGSKGQKRQIKKKYCISSKSQDPTIQWYGVISQENGILNNTVMKTSGLSWLLKLMTVYSVDTGLRGPLSSFVICLSINVVCKRNHCTSSFKTLMHEIRLNNTN